MAWAGNVCSGKRHTLEISRRGFHARSGGPSDISCVAGSRDYGCIRVDQCRGPIFWHLRHRWDLLETSQRVFEEPVLCGTGSVVGEPFDPIAAARPGNHRVPDAAGMDVRFITALVIALDVRARSAVSGPAFMRLILAVFGIAAILIVVWAVLWVIAGRSRG